MKPSPLIGEDELLERMSLSERLQHGLLVIAFVLLILTGLPLLLHGWKVFNWVFSQEKSFAVRGFIHRGAAIGLIIVAAWHVAFTIFTARGRRNLKDMLPRAKDFRDAIHSLGFNLGLTAFLQRRGLGNRFFRRHPFWLFRNPPLFDRCSYVEKFEYWAVVWGTGIMIVSGFFMWRVNLSLRLFPLWVHNIFILVHSYEAVLALLAVITWHLYNVHLNPDDFPMSWVWLNGKMTGRQLRLQHPLEYAQIRDQRKKGRRKKRPAREFVSASGASRSQTASMQR